MHLVASQLLHGHVSIWHTPHHPPDPDHVSHRSLTVRPLRPCRISPFPTLLSLLSLSLPQPSQPSTRLSSRGGLANLEGYEPLVIKILTLGPESQRNLQLSSGLQQCS